MNNEGRLKRIYDRTNGCCHLCWKKLSFINYGLFGERGAWEIEHSNPRAKGGTDHSNNLYAACIDCNRAKGMMTTRAARSWNGCARAPLSKQKCREAKVSDAALGVLIGGFVGLLLGPSAVAVSAIIGGIVGQGANSNEAR